MSPGTISAWMEKFGIESRSRSQAASNGNTTKLQDKDWLKEKYVDEWQPATDIANECNVSSDTVYSWLRKHSIPVRSISETKIGKPIEKLRDESWLREQYINNGLSEREIASKIGVNRSGVRCWLDNHEIKKRAPVWEGTNRGQLNDEQFLREHYQQGKSMAEIANIVNSHTTTVWEKFQQFGIEARGHDECHPSGPEHPQFKEGYTGNYGPNWTEQQRKTRIRDQARCQRCGINDARHLSKYGRRNHIHHIQKLRSFVTDNGDIEYGKANALSNLITLCERCHRKLEGMPIDRR